ncbi:MAG TPA: LytTR family DNA-binding domain-containing protein [Candidatus Polarisedimenticolia bacterium]|nr:LytTR family DNA-binding domain-containing protein [Candidatus Polarisedimenticolia bacterium]
MRALIVDDEPLARRGVVLRLKKFRDVEVVGECGDGASAVEKILELTPDVVFLDVQMPGMDGFEVLRALPKESMPAVIFLTAYEQHALRAFEVHALDYLLKPVNDERFSDAVGRARQAGDADSRTRMAERILSMLDRKPAKYVTHFPVRVGSRIQLVRTNDIEWIAAAGDYAELHSGGGCHLVRETMNSLEEKLDPTEFLRIHRSRIVRARCIRELRSLDNREYLVKLKDGSEHRSGRSFADRLDSWLSSKTS